MKNSKLILPFFVFGLLFTSCSKDDEVTVDPNPEVSEKEDTRNLEIEEFIYAGMNEIYLYKADMPKLADDHFASDIERRDFLDAFGSPEDLYDGLKSSQDRFSFMTSDYVALENSFAGVSTTNGMQLALYTVDTDGVFAIVNYVLPNTSAEEQGIKRGDAFTMIDGQQMKMGNYQSLMAPIDYTITLAKLEGTTIYQTEETVDLSKAAYNTNPVYITKTFDIDGQKVGYLMYNSFTANFDEQLNNAFAEFQTEGITELVLDLRYNGGGKVATAVGLAGMITGQFTGEIFSKQQWNEKYQNRWEAESYFDRFKDEITLNRGTDDARDIALNSLGLDRVYILTTKRSASASELMINGLDPYIEVIQIGTTTTGKFQASVTLYDSSDYGRTGANENHTYAIQPLVYKSANANGNTDYINGLTPDIEVKENLSEMGILGDANEALLEAALNHIAGIPQDQDKAAMAKKFADKFDLVGESGMNELNYQRMYIDKLPQTLGRE